MEALKARLFSALQAQQLQQQHLLSHAAQGAMRMHTPPAATLVPPIPPRQACTVAGVPSDRVTAHDQGSLFPFKDAWDLDCLQPLGGAARVPVPTTAHAFAGGPVSTHGLEELFAPDGADGTPAQGPNRCRSSDMRLGSLTVWELAGVLDKLPAGAIRLLREALALSQ